MEVVDGCLVEQDRIVPFHLAHGSGDPSSSGESSSETFSVQEVGLLAPGPTRTGALYPGQVGYMIAGEFYELLGCVHSMLVHVYHSVVALIRA